MPVASSPTSYTTTETDEQAPLLTSSPLTVHNRRPSTLLHVDLDDSLAVFFLCQVRSIFSYEGNHVRLKMNQNLVLFAVIFHCYACVSICCETGGVHNSIKTVRDQSADTLCLAGPDHDFLYTLFMYLPVDLYFWDILVDVPSLC